VSESKVHNRNDKKVAPSGLKRSEAKRCGEPVWPNSRRTELMEEPSKVQEAEPVQDGHKRYFLRSKRLRTDRSGTTGRFRIFIFVQKDGTPRNNKTL
jgi:hypothetical protein